MKNLLAENMLRFRAKNLSEPTKQKIVKLAEIISEQGTDRKTFQLKTRDGRSIGFRRSGQPSGRADGTVVGQTGDIYDINIQSVTRHKNAAGFVILAEVPGILSFRINVITNKIHVDNIRILANDVELIIGSSVYGADTFNKAIAPYLPEYLGKVPYFQQLQKSLSQPQQTNN